MTREEFARASAVHLIGIGGAGMSGLALMLKTSGRFVSGSDRTSTPVVDRLRAAGIAVRIGQSASHIADGTLLVVRSHAIADDNPEYREALRRRIPCISYPEAVGFLMDDRRGIAIAGTHGKTTTSGLLVWTLRHAGLSPSFIIGGEMIGVGSAEVGRGEFFVAEACEYRRSFLHLRPEVAVVTNIEEDHLDYYRDIDDIADAFRAFCAGVRHDGFLVLCADEPVVASTTGDIGRRKVTYGIRSGEWQAAAAFRSGGWVEFECRRAGKVAGRLRSPLHGVHNILNALAAAAVCTELGLGWKEISDAIASYPGIHRRCELIGEVRGVLVFDDYGHHPTEIRATLRAMRERYPNRRLIVVFQPHQYSRTRFLLNDFASSFEAADKVLVPDIYFVRDSERERALVNSGTLVTHIRAHGKEALYLPTFEEIVAYLREIVRRGDMVVTMGAGPVDAVGRQLLETA